MGKGSGLRRARAVVDILLPVRDAAQTLPEALACVRAQTLSDFRCLVLDDGSTDGSPMVAQAQSWADPRIEFQRLAPRGIAATLNDGLRMASAPYVARFDADDLMDPRRLEQQVAFLESHRDVHVVSCLVELFGDGLTPEMSAYADWLNSLVTHEDIVRDLFVESPLAHPSVTLRTEALRLLGGWRDLPLPEDYDLWLRAWRAGWRFGKVAEPLVSVRDHPRRLTRTDARYTARAFLECKAEHLTGAWALPGRDVVVWGAGRDGKRAAKALRARGAHIRHLVDIAPTKVGRRMIGVDVLPADSLREKSDCPIVVAVGVKGARAEIRGALAAWGYREGSDFVCFG